jgi:hypothetical protein
MSDEQRPKQHEEAGDEVEAHHHKKAANDEARDETEAESDEVEAHHHHRLAHHKKA